MGLTDSLPIIVKPIWEPTNDFKSDSFRVETTLKHTKWTAQAQYSLLAV